MKLFSKIEKPYLSAAIEKELLPHDFLKFSEFLKRELSLFEEEVDIKERYNENLERKFPEILNVVKEILQRDLPSFALIKAIEEKFVEDLKLIF